MRRSFPPLLLCALASSCASPDEGLRAEVAGLRARLEAFEYELRQHRAPAPQPEPPDDEPGQRCYAAFQASLRAAPPGRESRVPVSVSTELGEGELRWGCVKELFLGPGPCLGDGAELDPDNPRQVGLPPGKGTFVFRGARGARCAVTLDVPPEGRLSLHFTAAGAKLLRQGKEELVACEQPQEAKLRVVLQRPGAAVGRGCVQTALFPSCVESVSRAEAGPVELVVPAGRQQLRLLQDGMAAACFATIDAPAGATLELRLDASGKLRSARGTELSCTPAHTYRVRLRAPGAPAAEIGFDDGNGFHPELIPAGGARTVTLAAAQARVTVARCEGEPRTLCELTLAPPAGDSLELLVDAAGRVALEADPTHPLACAPGPFAP